MKHPKEILSMVEFVIWIEKITEKWADEYLIEITAETDVNNAIHFLYQKTIPNYANLLKTPLSLEQFIPMKDGKVLEEPGSAPIYTHSKKYIKEYQQACKSILFEGWEWDGCLHDGKEMYLREVLTYRNHAGEWFFRKKIIDDIIKSNLIGTPAFWNKVFK